MNKEWYGDIIAALRAISLRCYIVIVLLLIIMSFMPIFVSPYLVSLFLAMAMYVTMAASWNIISGMAGYVSFGHVVFWGLGAYITAIAINAGCPWPLALVLAGFGTAAMALAISYPILKLSGVYFGISMLAFAETVSLLVAHYKNLTGGGGGLYLVPMISLNDAYYLMAGLAVVTVFLTYLLRQTKFGWQLVAIRANEVAAASLAVNTTLRKIQALILSAFFPGMAGGIYVMNVCFIDPKTAFDIGITLRTIMMTMFGGIGTILGPVIGPITFTAISEFLWAKFPYYHKVVLGLFIIIIVLLLPRGIMPFLSGLTRRIGWRPVTMNGGERPRR